MKPLLIGLTGRKGHGKTTASTKIREVLIENGYFVHHLNFKDALVTTMKEKFPETLKQIGIVYEKSIEELFAEKPPVMRALMQNVGTEVYRGIRDSWWVDAWYQELFKVQERFSNEKLAIITDDVRFTNECMMLQAKGGFLLRVFRTGFEDIVSTTHQSETEMEFFVPHRTIVANNKETLEIFCEDAIKEIIQIHEHRS